ncbi:MAG: ATPase [Candidatus Pacebacteria bacterium CG_4_10_14_3_um_filter_34_15]|nr:MAG: ATPase [Candidatus Pacebacteria bacterium CG11_big_fil_rev_8_21_14_0_20_34_55]PIX82061.1 MAG: ATPase [Candidatus Pacebacteria bacterium CG_4_10_14_3_um_filter_34_15]PJC43809.1 MAG: ATPase [Candidatus Pacebacteria bacterium CG_4_9_14_0_2_um_filter_34_50]
MTDQQQTQITKDILASALKEQAESFQARDLGVEREILGELKKTIFAPQITVITGLRRVGKSTLLAQIANKYLKDGYYFINFEDERLLNFQVKDFDLLHETLISMFGEKRTFLFDEIQNVPEWERFVRRLHDQGYKFIVTGSNASLLSQELGTRLTGRSIRVELFPFSFREFLSFREVNVPNLKVLTTKQKGQLLKLTKEYIVSGGIPDSLKYPELEIHKTLYDDVLYRDIATRYKLDNVKSLKELTFYLVSNISTLISFNKLKELLKLGSVNTVKSYIDYLENSWLFFVVNKYAYSVKEQQIAAKKVYGIDTGLVGSVGFSFSENMGKLMENVVYLQLRRKRQDIYYYKTAQDYEVDFFLPKENAFIQVSQHFDAPETQERELRAITAAVLEQKEVTTHVVVTERDKQTIDREGLHIQVVPLYEWLLK